MAGFCGCKARRVALAVSEGKGEYSHNPGADFQSLANGETTTISFDVTATDQDGASDTEAVTVTITGTNDAATISVTDVDTGEGSLVSSTATYGTVSVVGGSWTYTLDNTNPNVDALDDGGTLTDTTGVDNIAGGSLNDAIIGDVGDDILSGNAGDDSISGGADDDILRGGDGTIISVTTTVPTT